MAENTRQYPSQRRYPPLHPLAHLRGVGLARIPSKTSVRLPAYYLAKAQPPPEWSPTQPWRPTSPASTASTSACSAPSRRPSSRLPTIGASRSERRRLTPTVRFSTNPVRYRCGGLNRTDFGGDSIPRRKMESWQSAAVPTPPNGCTRRSRESAPSAWSARSRPSRASATALTRGLPAPRHRTRVGPPVGPPSRGRRGRSGRPHNTRARPHEGVGARQPGAPAGQRGPQERVGFLRGGARPPLTTVITCIDDHGGSYRVEPICRMLETAPSTYNAASGCPYA